MTLPASSLPVKQLKEAVLEGQPLPTANTVSTPFGEAAPPVAMFVALTHVHSCNKPLDGAVKEKYACGLVYTVVVPQTGLLVMYDGSPAS
jgi:hypothetical protein